MAYLVLARKYRPQTFEEIVGQQHVTRTLINAIRSERVHHAYLLCGVRGLGKTTAARILAKALVCEQGPTPTPCNACTHCTAIMDGSSVDVLEIDGASNNSVEDIRNLRDQVHYLPQFTRRKIYIIDEVHMLTASAFNALLKTLEEPPPHVTFIFATTDPHKVLPTILSRVSRLDFRRVRARDLTAHLTEIAQKEGVKIDPEALAVVAGAAEGSVRDAMTALDKLIAFGEDPTQKGIAADEARQILGQADRASVAALAQSVFDRDATQALERFDAITEIGCDLQRFALSYLQHLRDLLVMITCGRHDALLDLPDILIDTLQAQAKSVDPRTVAQHFDRFSQVIEQLEGSRVPKMVLEMALLDLVHAERLVPLEDLVERLGALSTGGTGSGAGGGSPGTRSGPGRRSTGQGGAQRRADPRARAHAGAADTEVPTPDPGAPSDTAVPRPQPNAAAPRPQPNASAPRPQPNAAPRPQPHAATSPPNPRRDAARRPEPKPVDGGMSGMAEQFAAMLGAQRPSPPSNGTARSHASPTAARPHAPRGEFSLERPAARPQPDTPRPDAPPVDAGCNSSRCVPRDIVKLEGREPFEAWELFLDQVRGEDELLFAVLADFGLLELSPGKLRLAAPRGSFCADQLQHRAELRARLDELLAAIFGDTVKLTVEDATPCLPELPSLSLVEAQRRRRHQQRVEQQARTHPGIRAVLDAFGGSLAGVEPLQPPPRDAPGPER